MGDWMTYKTGIDVSKIKCNQITMTHEIPKHKMLQKGNKFALE